MTTALELAAALAAAADYRLANAALAVLGLFALTVSVAVEWPRIARAWRRVLVSVVAQQAVIAYASIEARASEAPPGLRVYGLFATLTALLVSATLVAFEGRHERRLP